MKIFDPQYINREIKEGVVLLSEPLLLDTNFSRTVILITEHGDEGSVGFILNKPQGRLLSDVIEGFDNFDSSLFSGGPVEPDTLHFIHSIGEHVPDTAKIGNDLYWGGDLSYIRQLANAKLLDYNQVKFFVGYSGWGQGHLEHEVDEKSWVVSNLDPAYVMSLSSESMWERCIEKLGSEFKVWLNYPVDPILN